jgi:hypothetical protein
MAELMRNANAAHKDYGDFKGVIESNPNFVPCDLDGIAERKGYFLVMEWKRPGEEISLGQQRMLQALAQTPKFSVIIMVGDTDNGVNLDHYWLLDNKGKPFKKGKDFEEFKQFYKLWYELIDDV